ncbi:UNVERIFIED_CONTAM: hypothetical protein H355_012479 [Colinus virginianus]|nr:hypothetical protein H355_012479 [Colinus virginianus]
MARLRVLALLGLMLAAVGSSPCYDPRGQPRRCMPVFENAAFGRVPLATNTCGSPPEDYCLQMGARDASQLCQRCDAADPLLHHNASSLTDFHSQEESTWWQSQSMAFGIQHPNSVNITLHLGSRGATLSGNGRLRGWDKDISPTSVQPCPGGYGERRGSWAHSPHPLQEWVTVTDLLISLNRLNTFGDDIFKDPKVLQSYYYAISDFSVGGRCKCNGHASECAPDEAGQLVCVCQHNTAGTDCQHCQPFYQDRPWARGTAEAANECLPCNCSGRSEECFYDAELFRRTGHGGHCLNCRDSTAGPRCEQCRENHYRWEQRAACQPCHCHPAGSLQPQCDSSGTCTCKANVTGWKCERCKDGYHSLSEGGCRPCDCDPAGSVGSCDPNTGHCTCKERVEGHLCNRCQPGWFNLQPHNPTGCTSCFCYGHSAVCTAADGYEVTHIRSDFREGLEDWAAAVGDVAVPLHWADGEISAEWDEEEPLDLRAPEKFLKNQRLSYGQPLSLLLGAEGNGTRAENGVSLLGVQLVLEGEGLEVTMSSTESQAQDGKQAVTFRLHEAEEGTEPLLSAFSFQRLLSNLTALRLRVSHGPGPGRLWLSQVQLTSARRGAGMRAGWVEECTCPLGYTGSFCQSCAPGFKRDIPFGGPFVTCVPCTCNQHGDCEPLSGHCRCLHNTEGPSCERCSPGFYGNPFTGRIDDCKPCPCPGSSPCTQLPGTGEVVCTHCPLGQRGKRCELCDDGFFGDPLGQRGPVRPCVPCQCHGNVDLNAVGNCDSVSGRCLRCLYNTTGEQCHQCRPGFYGDALAPSPTEKCAPCNCSPLGSTSAQCHENSTCPCRPGFVGYKCDRCQANFFPDPPSSSCQPCPSCYGLVKDGAEWLRVKLQEVEEWLQAPGCELHLGQPPVMGDAGRGDGLSTQHLLQGAHATLSVQVGRLSGMLSSAGSRLSNAIRASGCSSHGPSKTCMLLSEIGAVLQSAQREILHAADTLAATEIPQEIPLQPTNWSRWAMEAKVLAEGHGDTAAQVEVMVKRALGASNTSHELLRMLLEGRVAQEAQQELEDRYEEIQQAWEELGAGMADVAAEARRALTAIQEENAGMAKKIQQAAEPGQVSSIQLLFASHAVLISTALLYPVLGGALLESLVALSPQQVLLVQAGALAQEVAALEQAVQMQEPAAQQSIAESRSMAAGLLQDLQGTRSFVQLQDRAGSAHDLSTSAVSQGKAVLSGAESLLGSLEGMRKVLGHRKGRAALRRRMAHVRDRTMVEAQKKIKQAEKMLGNSLSVSSMARRKAGEAEHVAGESSKRAQAVLQGSKQARKHTRMLSVRVNETHQELSRQQRMAEELRGSLEEAEQVGTEVSRMAKSLQEARGSLMADIETLNDLLHSLGGLEPGMEAEAVLGAGQLQLERLRLRLSAPGALAMQLGQLQQEAEQQQDRIRAFESDLAEIRADKQNLEDILRSLPEGCSKWQ